MAAASGVTLNISAARLPLLPGVREIAAQNRSGGMGSNLEHFGASTQIDPAVPDDLVPVLFDPQTSGGLLIAASEEFAERLAADLEAAGVPAAQIGRAVPAMSFSVQIAS
jgi:selenide,water dikinase